MNPESPEKSFLCSKIAVIFRHWKSSTSAAMHLMLRLMSLLNWTKNGNWLGIDVGMVTCEVRDMMGISFVVFSISDTIIASCFLIAPITACTLSIPMSSKAAADVVGF